MVLQMAERLAVMLVAVRAVSSGPRSAAHSAVYWVLQWAAVRVARSAGVMAGLSEKRTAECLAVPTENYLAELRVDGTAAYSDGCLVVQKAVPMAALMVEYSGQ